MRLIFTSALLFVMLMVPAGMVKASINEGPDPVGMCLAGDYNTDRGECLNLKNKSINEGPDPVG